MTSYSEDSNQNEASMKSQRQQRALEGMLDLIQSWQKKGVSAAQARESMGHMLAAIQTKMADVQDPSKVNLGDLFSLLMGPGHFNREEKELVQAVFLQAAKLKKKLNSADNRKLGGASKKNRFKRPVDKRYI